MYINLGIKYHQSHYQKGLSHSFNHPRSGFSTTTLDYSSPLVELKRNNLTESIHRGAIVVCDATGKRIAGIGSPSMATFLRSTAKPLQIIPILLTGAAKHYGLNNSELACLCGSLNGEDFQVNAILSIFNKTGLQTELLACGVHPPRHPSTAKILAERGEKPSPLHNSCAGKHTGILLLCSYLGLNPTGYYQIDHPVQKIILKSIAEICCYPIEQFGIGVDDCGMPVFRLPLITLAGAYARLAAPAQYNFSTDKIAAIEHLMTACLEHPEMIAGTNRLCTRIIQASSKRVFAKTGAEGSYALAIPNQGLGIAIQIEDGASRALSPVICELLHILGELDSAKLEGPLADLYHPKIKNHRAEIVGELLPIFNFEL